MQHMGGDMLKRLRVEAGFTQEQLARKIGMSRETVINLEKEKAGPIEETKLIVLRTWYDACKSKASDDAKSSFVEYLKVLLGIK